MRKHPWSLIPPAVRRAWLSLLVPVLLLLSWTVTAWAGPNIGYLIDRLKNGEDFRVRTSAALSLGKTHNRRALKPLCRALRKDKESVVRAASAAGLGKLGDKGGISCLKRAKGGERDSSVRSAISNAIRQLKSGAASIPAGAKYYISIGKITNKSKHSSVGSQVRRLVKQKLHAAGNMAIAPKGESGGRARQVQKKYKLKGLQLKIKVFRFKHKGGKLSLKLSVVVTSYPGKDIKGEFRPKVAVAADSDDEETRDALLSAALDTAISSLKKVAASL